MKKKMITGNMFVRKWEGKLNKAVICIVIDADSIPNIKSESMSVIAGEEIMGSIRIQSTGGQLDISKHTIGEGFDGILTMPLWRV